MSKASLIVSVIGITLLWSVGGCTFGWDSHASRPDLEPSQFGGGPDRYGPANTLSADVKNDYLSGGIRRTAQPDPLASPEAGRVEQTSALAPSEALEAISGAFHAGADKVSGAFRTGVDKASEMLTPSPPAKKSGDPISLATPAKPGAELYVAAARFSERSQRPAQAERHYQRALEIDPRHAEALVGYARLKDRQGELDKAAGLYQRALKVQPSDPSILNDLGLCLARQRKLRESIPLFDRAIRLEPKKWLYRNNIAMVLVETGQIDAAVSHLKAVQEPAVAYYNVGYMLQKKGDREAAAGFFAKALEEKPSLAAARVWLEKLTSPAAPGAPSGPRVARDPRLNSGATPGTPPALRGPSTGPRMGPVAPTPGARGLAPMTVPALGPGLPPGRALAAPPSSRSAPLPPAPSLGRPYSGPTSSPKRIPIVHPLPPVEGGTIPME